MPNIRLELTNDEFEVCKEGEEGCVGLWLDNDCLSTWKPTELPGDISLGILRNMFKDVYKQGQDARSAEIKKLLGAR